MAAKRTLNIPMYDEKVVPEGADHDGVIDVESFDDDPTFGDRVRSGFAAASAARAARPKTQSKERERRQRAAARQATQERAQFVQDAKSDPLKQLRIDTARAGEAYMESLRRSGILAEGQTKETQREQLSGMHQIYARMMVLQCVSPLQQGLSSESVVSALGMAASMWMLSPTFRVQMGNFAANISKTIQHKIAERAEKRDDKVKGRYDKLVARGKGDQMPDRWQRRLESIRFAERGHRLLFTAQSAAMTEVALAEAAYADMRRPGADPAAVHDRYESALSALYGYAEADGLEREEVSRSMRVIVGQRLEREPELASVFAELGHGRFVRSEAATDAPMWKGDFLDIYEGRRVMSGSFRVRPPMTKTEHRSLMAETLSAEMVQANSPEQMNDVLSQYVVASSVGQHPDVVDQVEDVAAQRRLGKVRSMFASMNADGLSAQDQHDAYSLAYVDAVEILQAARPDLGSAWLAQYGEDWRAKVAEEMANFQEMGAAAERAKARKAQATRESRSARPRTSRSAPDEADTPIREEDIVDAEVVEDEPASAPASPATETHAERSAHTRRDERLRIEDIAFPADSLEDEQEESDFIEGEVVEDHELDAAAARKAILGSTKSTAPVGSSDGPSTSAKVKRARVNQSYNEVDTGNITGFGSDDAAPLRDPGFELG
jgi:hypothetical protein